MNFSEKKEALFIDLHKKVLEVLNHHWNGSVEERDKSCRYALDSFNNSQLQLVLNASPSAVLIYNFVESKYEFVSKNVISIMGCSAEDLMAKDGYQFSFTRFKPEHAEIFATKVTPKAMEYMALYSQQKRVKDFKMSFTVQAKNRKEEYAWTLMQINILETDENGFPLLGIQFLTDIQDHKKDEMLFFSILLKDSKEYYTRVHTETFPSIEKEFVLSTRELEVLNLSGRGLNALQIADQLFISKHTVHSHKKNILRKTACSNIIEALRTVTIHGLM